MQYSGKRGVSGALCFTVAREGLVGFTNFSIFFYSHADLAPVPFNASASFSESSISEVLEESRTDLSEALSEAVSEGSGSQCLSSPRWGGGGNCNSWVWW